jgi:hypothetical protein
MIGKTNSYDVRVSSRRGADQAGPCSSPLTALTPQLPPASLVRGPVCWERSFSRCFLRSRSVRTGELNLPHSDAQHGERSPLSPRRAPVGLLWRITNRPLLVSYLSPAASDPFAGTPQPSRLTPPHLPRTGTANSRRRPGARCQSCSRRRRSRGRPWRGRPGRWSAARRAE